jgi:anti-sigma regulatory factor (Ser/Thr protein kinase)
MTQTELKISTDPADRKTVLDAVEALAAQHQFPTRATHDIELALEEHLTNISTYAYDEGETRRDIHVRFTLEGRELEVQVEDAGRAFNPLDQPTPDLTSPIEERAIGGLGIHLIRKSVDALEYRRERERNVLVMRKKV